MNNGYSVNDQAKAEKFSGNGPMVFVRVMRKNLIAIRELFALRYHPERHYMRGPGPAYARKQRLKDMQQKASDQLPKTARQFAATT